jgi:hypothetical protein
VDDEGDRLALAELERDAPDRLDLAEALSDLADTCPDCHVPHEWTNKITRKM